MKYTSRFFFVPFGSYIVCQPKVGETYERAFGRLKRLSRSYLKYGRAFRVERAGDDLIWRRVKLGHQCKLGRWRELFPGESIVINALATDRDLKAASLTAKYLKSRKEGTFSLVLYQKALTVTRDEK